MHQILKIIRIKGSFKVENETPVVFVPGSSRDIISCRKWYCSKVWDPIIGSEWTQWGDLKHLELAVDGYTDADGQFPIVIDNGNFGQNGIFMYYMGGLIESAKIYGPIVNKLNPNISNRDNCILCSI
ncbi:hypothetical protein KHA80_05470 [Anaerobacillus sp. HL2]|nr:hypothetical protein KHA80_05470 [Anaerobacillus sp. HL2]